MLVYTYSGTSTVPLTTTTYSVEADHLGTPRLITDSTQAPRWSWHSAPYGDTLPNENPASKGVLVYNLRFPGQYFDKETNTHYNWHRDYEATTGRYLQSDPIGLAAGINTYVYVLANPTALVDPTGLDVDVCFLMRAASGAGHVGLGPAGTGRTQGFYPLTSNFLKGPGQVKDDEGDGLCKRVPADKKQDDCVAACVSNRKSNPGEYRFFSRQCTSFVRDCLQQCGIPAGNYRGPTPDRFFDQLPGRSLVGDGR
jgi:RHS repeat-associated protein